VGLGEKFLDAEWSQLAAPTKRWTAPANEVTPHSIILFQRPLREQSAISSAYVVPRNLNPLNIVIDTLYFPDVEVYHGCQIHLP